MSTRQTFAHNVAGRARRIGWPVELLSSGGYKITCPTGHVHTVHLTNSDVNADKNIIGDLNTHGFEEAELAFQRKKNKEREEKIEQDRIKNTERLEKLAKQAKMVNRAAGIYGDSDIDTDTILGLHELPATFNRVLITKELAERFLERNTDNRPIRRGDIEELKVALTSGLFTYTHQGIAFDVRGVLQDGQQRLTAIAESGIPTLMQISVGMPVENFDVVDTGRRRSYGDVLAKEGFHNVNKLGAQCRMIYIYDRKLQYNQKVPNAAVQQVAVDGGDLLFESTTVGVNLYNAFRIIATPASVATYLLWREVGKENEATREFLSGLITGANLIEGDPRLVLRTMIMNTAKKKGRRYPMEHLALFLKTWNLYVSGVTNRQIMAWRKDEKMPVIKKPS